MPEFRFERMIDLAQVRHLLESHHRLSRIAYGIVDPEGNVLIAVGWQDICERFYRISPVGNARCRESNAYIHDHLLGCEGDYLESKCENGLIDAALPIVISEKHVASFYAGQFFYEDDRPDNAFFRKQGEELGFEVDDFLAALERVPVFSREYVRDNMLFLRDMVNVMAETGFNNLRLAREMEERKFAEQRLKLLGFALDNVHEAAFLMDLSGRFHYVNEKACRSLDYTAEELLGMVIPDIDPDFSLESLPDVFERLLEQGTHTFETRHRAKDGHVFPVEITSTVLEYNGARYNLALVRDITERKAAQTMLEDERLLLKTLIQTLPDPVWLKDVNGVYIACNAVFGRLYDDTPSGIAGRTDNDYVDDELAAFFQQKDREAIAAGRSCTNEEWVTYVTDGHRALWETTKTPVYDTNGQVVGALGIARDITERKLMEGALRESEQKYRTLAENLPDNVIRYDRECRATYSNSRLTETVVIEKERFLGKTPLEAHPETAETAGQYERIIRQVLAVGIPDELEIVVPHPEGGLRTHLVRIVAERDAAGAITGALAIGSDITERKQMEEQLRASEQRFREIFDNSLDCLYLLEVTEDGRFRNLEVNPASEASFGMSRAELIGKCVDETVPEETARAVMTKYRRCMEAGIAIEEELELDLPSGRRFYHSTLIPVHDDTGRVYRILGITRDITAHKGMEDLLRLSEQKFRTLAENSPNIIIRYDRDCRRTFVNPAYVRETGIAAELARDATPDMVWGDVSMSVLEYRKLLECAMESGEPAEIVLELRRLDTGRTTNHAFHVVAERNPDGGIIGCLAIGHNITALKEAELRLSKLAAGVPGFLYTYRLRPDGTACLPYASPQIIDIYGFLPETVMEDAAETLARIHPDDLSRVRDSIAESARTLSTWRAEYRIRNPEKGDIWVEGRSMPEAQPDGAIVWFGFVHDITERKRIEESLRVKREQLTAMTVELSLAEERERRRIAAELHDHIGQTLLLSRIKLGTLADVFESGDDENTYEEIQSLLERTIRDVRSLTQQLHPPVLDGVGLEAALDWLAKRMEADYSLPVEFIDDRNVKPLSEELRAVVYQSARELLINVAKHARTEEARLIVGREADMLVLTVADEGCGFSCGSDHGAQMPVECSFGLFNIQQRIKLLGGSVAIDSAPGRGTRATIRVPLLPVEHIQEINGATT